MINIFATGCTTGNTSGTGEGYCDLLTFGDLRGMDITVKGNTFTVATDDFLVKQRSNILAKNTYPLTDLFNFEQNTPDNEMATSSVGIKYEIRAGKPEFTITYAKSACFHRSVFEKKGFGKFDVKLYFDKGVLLAKSVDATTLKGFDCGMFSVGTLKLQQGTDPQQTKVMFQFTNAEEFNTRWVFLSYDSIGADLNEETGIIETSISVNAVPAVGATTVVVNVVSACNGGAITGLTGATKWKLGGVQASAHTISGVTESATVAGRYTITFSTALIATDTVAPYLNNGTVDAVEDINGLKYAGASTAVTIV